MVITIRKRMLLILPLALLLLAAAAALTSGLWRREPVKRALGGAVHAFRHPGTEVQPVAALDFGEDTARFNRPSSRPPLENPYTFAQFQNKHIPPFSRSREVVLAYWGILKDASNMPGFSGGCGTIGDASLPYPCAYELLTPDAKKRMPPAAFLDSFLGYGHILLLQLHPAAAPPGTPSDTAFYMVELESITGRPETDEQHLREPGGSLFSYHYGLVTVKNLPGDGWKIEQLDFIPESFLCAPFHGWSYDAASIVSIVYGNNLGLVERIDKTEIQDALVTVSASGHGIKYRFAFARLTNGYDILLRQYVYRDGQWREENLLTPDWDYLQLGPGHLG